MEKRTLQKGGEESFFPGASRRSSDRFEASAKKKKGRDRSTDGIRKKRGSLATTLKGKKGVPVAGPIGRELHC